MQYHQNGFHPGDPDVKPASAIWRDGAGALPDTVDVLIAGSGPAGLCLGAQLASVPGIRTMLVEPKLGPMEKGQADGISVRSMEMFQAFGFAEKVQREAVWINETTFWTPGEGAALHRAVRRLFGSGGLGANRRVGSEAARLDFGGVYRLFIRVADYDTLLQGLGRAWLRYNSAGAVTWDEVAPGSARGQITGVAGYTEEMWHSVAGRLEQILMLAGAKSAAEKWKTWT